jgi:hypothetical protein
MRAASAFFPEIPAEKSLSRPQKPEMEPQLGPIGAVLSWSMVH